MRVAASVAIAGLIVLGASGCEFISPQDTTRITQVADGLNGTVGTIEIRDALLFTATGREANLVAAFVNPGSSPVTVSMQYTSASGPTTKQVTVPANGFVEVQPIGAQSVQFSDVTVQAGGLFPVYFTADGAGTTVKIPVLDGTLPGYETLTPTPSAIPKNLPVPSPSTSGTPAPVDSAVPSTTATAPAAG